MSGNGFTIKPHPWLTDLIKIYFSNDYEKTPGYKRFAPKLLSVDRVAIQQTLEKGLGYIKELWGEDFIEKEYFLLFRERAMSGEWCLLRLIEELQLRAETRDPKNSCQEFASL